MIQNTKFLFKVTKLLQRNGNNSKMVGKFFFLDENWQSLSYIKTDTEN